MVGIVAASRPWHVTIRDQTCPGRQLLPRHPRPPWGRQRDQSRRSRRSCRSLGIGTRTRGTPSPRRRAPLPGPRRRPPRAGGPTTTAAAASRWTQPSRSRPGSGRGPESGGIDGRLLEAGVAAVLGAGLAAPLSALAEDGDEARLGGLLPVAELRRLVGVPGLDEQVPKRRVQWGCAGCSAGPGDGSWRRWQPRRARPGGPRRGGGAPARGACRPGRGSGAWRISGRAGGSRTTAPRCRTRSSAWPAGPGCRAPCSGAAWRRRRACGRGS